MGRQCARAITMLTLTVTLLGCSEAGNPGEIPASKDAKATHDAIENPAGIAEKKAPTKKVGNELPPQPPK